MPFSRHKVVDNRTKKSEWTQNSLKHSTSQVYTEYASLWPKFNFVSLYDQPYSRYKIVENWKCTQWPQSGIKHLTVESTLYTPNTHPWGHKFTPFCSTTRHFWDTRLSKIGNAPNDTRMTLGTWLTKMHWLLIPEAQIKVRFALRPAVSEI